MSMSAQNITETRLTCSSTTFRALLEAGLNKEETARMCIDAFLHIALDPILLAPGESEDNCRHVGFTAQWLSPRVCTLLATSTASKTIRLTGVTDYVVVIFNSSSEARQYIGVSETPFTVFTEDGVSATPWEAKSIDIPPGSMPALAEAVAQAMLVMEHTGATLQPFAVTNGRVFHYNVLRREAMPSGCVEYRYSHIARLNAARVYGRSIKVWMEDLREVLAYMLEWLYAKE